MSKKETQQKKSNLVYEIKRDVPISAIIYIISLGIISVVTLMLGLLCFHESYGLPKHLGILFISLFVIAFAFSFLYFKLVIKFDKTSLKIYTDHIEYFDYKFFGGSVKTSYVRAKEIQSVVLKHYSFYNSATIYFSTGENNGYKKWSLKIRNIKHFKEASSILKELAVGK